MSKHRPNFEIRVFHARNPPPSSRNLVKTRARFLGCNNQKCGSLLADSPCKIDISGSQNRKIVRLRRSFPLVNRTFSDPKPQNFLACGPISPLKSPKAGPSFGRNLEISKSEISKTGGVPGMKYPDGFFEISRYYNVS